MTLQNKTLVITGVSSGIGAEVARLARFQGATVIGLDRNKPTMTLDGFVKIDMGDTDSIDQAVKQLPGNIDALCNIAGVPGTAPADLIGRVNYLGLRHLTTELLPSFNEGGSIVNIASILGIEWPKRLEQHKALAATESFEDGAAWLQSNPVPSQTCYQYFKEALIVWTQVQAQPWFLRTSVRMNSVAPGPVFTPILDDFVTMLGAERAQADAERMKRPAYADEIAPVITFLCSDESRWINGVNIAVDGGLASTYL